MAKEEDKLENAYRKFANTKSDFGSDHIEGPARPEELVKEKQPSSSAASPSHDNDHEETPGSEHSPALSLANKKISEQLELKRAAKIMIMSWFLNLAGANVNAFLYNLMHKTTKIKAKDIMLDESDLETSTSYFNIGDSKLMSWLDKIPDVIWGFLSMQYFFMGKIEDAPKTIIIKDADKEGKEAAK